ncbi:MAG: MOSC domain-containing protein, partial [Cyclobacteriaceae bacterium]|nr:MOSC domain-containing protein [Cyclobacteriaceae bacterium]
YGGAAYDEDTWATFSIGKADFTGIKPCVRCVFTTIDQDTGMSGKEPLKTLATYRNKGEGVIFGLNAIAGNFKTIKIGDKIVVHEIL